MPVPFRDLRVTIPAPMPPQWDPEFSLPPEERECVVGVASLIVRLALAEGVLAWALTKAVDLGNVVSHVAQAKELLATTGADEAFFGHLDLVWTVVRERVPRPKSAPPRSPVARPSAAEPEEA